MSDDYSRRVNKRMEEERREFDTLQVRYQAQLDRWWWGQRAAEAEERRIKRELDPFGLGLYDGD